MARFRKLVDRPRPAADINITNLVDVTLVLLIIFIIVAPMLKQGLKIQLPEVKVAERLGQHSILVEMDIKGALTLNGEPIGLDELAPTLKERRAAHPDWPVYFKTDGKNTIQNAAEIWSAMLEAGIHDFGLVTETRQSS